jgi:hypothetical protein
MSNKYFDIGEFWVFVIAGFFTMVSLCGVHVLGYYGSVGYNAEHAANGIIEISNSLTFVHELNSLYLVISFLFVCVLAAILSSIRPIKATWGKSAIFRYICVIAFTAICFYGVYELSVLTPISLNGSTILHDNSINAISDDYVQTCVNLIGITPIVFGGTIFFYICSIWLCGVDYLLKPEQEWLWGKVTNAIGTVWKMVYV